MCAEPPPLRRLSLWHDTAGTDWTPRPALAGDLDVDVAVVGAGFTGLWTAYYLAEADPTLRIAVLEAEVAGFGASGRNGGWCSALFPASLRRAGRACPAASAALAQHARDARDRRRGGPGGRAPRASTPDLSQGRHDHAGRARRAQWQRARAEVAEARAWGRGEDDLRLLDAARGRGGAAAPAAPLGATYTPDCAAHPPRPAGARAGRRGRAPRRPHPRAHPRCTRDRARPRAAPGTGRCAPRRRRPRDRGLHREPARAPRAPWCPSTR